MQLGGYQSTLDDPAWFSPEPWFSLKIAQIHDYVELFCQERPSANFFSMKAETLFCAQSLFRTAICCALQDLMISAGVVITVPWREFYEFWRSADNGKCVQTILASLFVKGNDVIQHPTPRLQEHSEQIWSRYVWILPGLWKSFGSIPRERLRSHGRSTQYVWREFKCDAKSSNCFSK